MAANAQATTYRFTNFWLDKLEGVFVETLSLRSESGEGRFSRRLLPLFQTCNRRINRRGEKRKINMNPSIQFKMTVPTIRNSVRHSPIRRVSLLIPLVFVCFGLSPAVRAVSPAPDGGYPDFNTAEGDDALFSLTTGVGNAAIGAEALFSNTTGTFNTATGIGALLNNTTASNNTATGAGALFSNTTIGVNSGDDNTATGFVALFSNTTGDHNTAVGSQALDRNTIGGQNTATGT